MDEIKVGDRVEMDGYRGTVIAVSGPLARVRYDDVDIGECTGLVSGLVKLGDDDDEDE